MIQTKIAIVFSQVFLETFGVKINTKDVNIQKTRPEITGDFTINVFPFVRFAKKSPEETASILGDAIKSQISDIKTFNVIKGFLNFCISDSYWLQAFQDAAIDPDFGFKEVDEKSQPVLIEYSSPNTNKPLHLGHIRNNRLGYSIAEVLRAAGVNAKK